MIVKISQIIPRISSKKLAMVAAVNILRIAIGLVITTSGQSPVRQDSGFYPDKSFARASGQANSNDSSAAAPERQMPKSTRVGSPDIGWG
jgi:hypothetical protein